MLLTYHRQINLRDLSWCFVEIHPALVRPGVAAKKMINSDLTDGPDWPYPANPI
jgi:hypothetical protein